MKELALAWPRVASLHLQSGLFTGHNRPQASLGCLLLFAEHCRVRLAPHLSNHSPATQRDAFPNLSPEFMSRGSSRRSFQMYLRS
ncbi:hypothetical protein DFH08DRAFT_1082593 [Mycena albidolilacea]|uniref:Uncharacterized protein n=1 Tax=Mycena albidolilacea TaxID=1033008 RepID=A0AAD7ENC3_9AGAR|nr:hypothetical protein DFH08DRAFT_1082593 [Mycena albidolilacea]